MSHKATTWLAEIDPKQLKSSDFRVLFHLCDCHNPSLGCFPTQAYLVARTGLSRSVINTALARMEAAGLIKRHQSRDEVTFRQRPTRYTLGFEMDRPAGKGGDDGGSDDGPDGVGTGLESGPKPCPKSGHGKKASRVRQAGRGAVSGSEAVPCPAGRQSRVRQAGHKPVNEPVNNPEPQRADGTDASNAAAFWAHQVKSKGFIPASVMTDELRAEILHFGLASESDFEDAGWGG